MELDSKPRLKLNYWTMKSLKIVSSGLLFSLLVFSCLNLKSQNIALHKEYSLSTMPNYKLSGNGLAALTDGVEIQGDKFWQRQTTVGWSKVGEVVIDIDLKENEPIGAVSFNTARGSAAEVDYPKHVFLFLSEDNKRFVYCGDIVKSDENVSGGYRVNKFVLNDIGVDGRYAKLYIIPQGKYIFCDEIQFVKEPKVRGNKSKRLEIIEANVIKAFVNNLIILNQTVDKFNNYLEKEGVSERISYVNSPKAKVSNLKSELEDSFYAKRREILSSRFKKALIINKVDIWKDDLFAEIPDSRSFDSRFNINIFEGGTDYGGVQITNTNNEKTEVIFEVEGDEGSVAIQLFSLPTVVSRNNQFLIDPLVKLTGNKLVIGPGRSEIIGFSVKGLKLGSFKPKIIINGAQKEEVDLNVKVVGLDFTDKNVLNANNWAYLDYPLLKGRKSNAIEDLKSHYINTTVVRAKYIPKLNSKDFTNLKAYLSNFPRQNNVLLFVNWQNKKDWSSSKAVFMSDEWKTLFKDWYLAMLQTLSKAGYDKDKIYWYPYDEVNGNYINELIDFSNWAKRELPDLQLFATIMNKNGTKVIPYVDLVQLKEILVSESGLKPKKQLWLYEVIEDASDRSPIKDYRLMAWRAFYYDISGVGFWNYADNGKSDNPLTRNHSDIDRDYAVIYTDSNGKIITSRRWEAFKLGIEDYQLLVDHGKKFGIEATKKKIRKIFDENGYVLLTTIREDIFNDIH